MSACPPRFKARIAGFLYSFPTLAGGVALFGSHRLVSGDVLADASLLRLVFGADVIAALCCLAVTLLFYDTFEPANRGLSLLAAFFSLAGSAIGALSCIFHLASLVVLGDSPYLRVLKVGQLQTMALTFLKLGTRSYTTSALFFGFYCLLIGYLTFRSTGLLRIIEARIARSFNLKDGHLHVGRIESRVVGERT